MFEYTPEITQDYVRRLQQPIKQQGAIDIGKARGEALRRGMSGDPFEALRVGAAENTRDTNLANTASDLQFKIAGLQRDERLQNTNWARESAFKTAEAEKERDFQARMQNQQLEYAKALEKARRREAQRSFFPNLIGNMLGFGLGSQLGRAKLF